MFRALSWKSPFAIWGGGGGGGGEIDAAHK